MKTIKLICLVYLFVFGHSLTSAQGIGAVWFLQFPVSPAQNAMGATGTSLPSDDPYAFLFNPAQLGYGSIENNFSMIFYPDKTYLFNQEDLTLSGGAVNIGYNFKNEFSIPISVGIGFASQGVKIFYSEQSFNAYSLSAALDYYVQFSAGVTLKDINVSEGDYPGGNFEVSTSAIDYGFLLNIPIYKLIDQNQTVNIFPGFVEKPFLDFSLGYTKANTGDEVSFPPYGFEAPLHRTARIGYGVSAGIDLLTQKNTVNLFDISFTVDAEDFLVKHLTGDEFEYQGGIGDIDFAENVIGIKGDQDVISRAGLQISLMETLVLRNGHYSSAYFMYSTHGVELRAKGLLKLLHNYSNDKTTEFIAEHFDLRFYSSSYAYDSFNETNINGIALVISGFNF